MSRVSLDAPEKILSLSVPHTGTHFVSQHVLRDKNKLVGHIPPNRGREWGICRQVEQYPTIVPLRHPLRWLGSFYSRGEVPDLGCWNTLIDTLDPIGVYYLPLDTEDRDSYLDVIEEFTGPVSRDWPVYYSSGKTVKPPDYMVDRVMSYMEQRKDFFGRFYETD